MQTAAAIALTPGLQAQQNPGGSSVGGGGIYVFAIGAIVAVLLAALLFVGIGQIRDRRRHRDLARDLDHGFSLLERQLEGLASRGDVATDDARERLAAARALQRRGSGVAVLRATRHTLLEGLAAAHCARTMAGLEAGTAPPPPNNAPLTPEPVTTVVEGVPHTGLAQYAPGSPHHFPGGTLAGVDVPGGWYAEAFWEPLLLGSPVQAGSATGR